LDKKLNDKKTSEIKKKFYWERDVFKPSKAKKKKAIIYKEKDFRLFSENQRLNISISLVSVRILLDH